MFNLGILIDDWIQSRPSQVGPQIDDVKFSLDWFYINDKWKILDLKE